MVKRRMMSSKILFADKFLGVEAREKVLYFYMIAQADDEGFVDNVESLKRVLGYRAERLENLEESGLIIRFKSGVVAIRHWHVHNSIPKSKYTPTIHLNEMRQLTLKDGVYYLRSEQ